MNQNTHIRASFEELRNNTLVALLNKLINGGLHPRATIIGCPKAAFDCENYVEYVLSGDSRLIYDSSRFCCYFLFHPLDSRSKVQE